MDRNEIKNLIETDKTYLNIELGSTRIKAVLIVPDYTTIASSNYGWKINAWATVFKDFLVSIGQTPDMNKIFTAMFTEALNGETNAGGLLLYNYLSGEPITGLTGGRPLFAKTLESKLNFAKFISA